MKRGFGIVAVVLMLPLLAGCNPGDPGESSSAPPTSVGEPSKTVTPSGTPTATAAPEAGPAFTMPASCDELAGPDLLAVFADPKRTKTLFNSTNGEGMFTDTTFDPHQEGGIPFGCLWGVPNVDLNTFTLTVQAVNQQSHEGIVATLDGDPTLVKTVDGDIVTWTRVGAETGQPADQLLIHVLRPDSWMTGWASLGGEQSRERISGYLDQVAAHLYQ